MPQTRSLFRDYTLVIAAVTLMATAVLCATVDWAVRGASHSAIAQGVDTDMAGLADIYATSGRDELVKRIKDRLALSAGPGVERHYLLTDGAANHVVGDIGRWPMLSAENSQADFVMMDGTIPVYARATQFGPDARIVVAHEYGQWTAFLKRIRTVMAAMAAGIALLVIGFGAFGAHRLSRRIAGLNQAFGAIEGGALNVRLPGEQSRDELGRLSIHGNRMLDRLSALVRSHREISDHTAHEIRTPLTHLDHRLVQIMQRPEVGADSESGRLIGTARQDIRNVVSMLDSLLDISHSEASKGDFRSLPEIDFSTLVQRMSDIYADSALDLEIGFTAKIAPDIKVRGDEMQLARLLSNLLDNAFKYCNADRGRIEITLAPGPRLTVVDNGEGIPPDMKERIFERFARVGMKNAKGHGLGLALARAIAERHGFKLFVADYAPGSMFVVERSAVDA